MRFLKNLLQGNQGKLVYNLFVPIFSILRGGGDQVQLDPVLIRKGTLDTPHVLYGFTGKICTAAVDTCNSMGGLGFSFSKLACESDDVRV